jgi:hypothetical protein
MELPEVACALVLKVAVQFESVVAAPAGDKPDIDDVTAGQPRPLYSSCQGHSH